jgi:hypothetical protein
MMTNRRLWVLVDSGKHPRKGERPAVAPVLMVAIIVAIVLVAGVGAYYFLGAGSASSTSSTGTSSAQRTGTSSAGSSSTGSAGVSTYSGTFNFSVPLGPGGERVLSNGTVQTYASVQVASGSFTFSVAAFNKSGSGSGHGTLVVTATGFCSGKTTVPYTFLIPDATTVLGNLTIFFGTPTPANFTVPLTCTGPMAGVSTATNNPAPFLSVFPNEITAAAMPVTVTQHLPGNINYFYNITRTG